MKQMIFVFLAIVMIATFFAAPVVADGVAVPDTVECRIHVVKDGDWLSKIAEEEYGEAFLYGPIVIASGIDRPDRIFPGDTLLVPLSPVVKNAVYVYNGQIVGRTPDIPTVSVGTSVTEPTNGHNDGLSEILAQLKALQEQVVQLQSQIKAFPSAPETLYVKCDEEKVSSVVSAQKRTYRYKRPVSLALNGWNSRNGWAKVGGEFAIPLSQYFDFTLGGGSMRLPDLIQGNSNLGISVIGDELHYRLNYRSTYEQLGWNGYVSGGLKIYFGNFNQEVK